MEIENNLKKIINNYQLQDKKNVSNYYEAIDKYNILISKGLIKPRGYRIYNNIYNEKIQTVKNE